MSWDIFIQIKVVKTMKIYPTGQGFVIFWISQQSPDIESKGIDCEERAKSRGC